MKLKVLMEQAFLPNHTKVYNVKVVFVDDHEWNFYTPEEAENKKNEIEAQIRQMEGVPTCNPIVATPQGGNACVTSVVESDTDEGLECRLCGAVFQTKSGLKRHKKKHGEN